MDDILSELKDKVNGDMIVSYTMSVVGKFANSPYARIREDDTLANAVILTMLESVKDLNEFINKYKSFKGVAQLIKDSGLFDLVISIDSSLQKDTEQIHHAISIYNEIITNKEYLELISDSIYKLPPDFGEEESYCNGSLKRKVDFFHLVEEKIDEIYKDLLQRIASDAE